MRMPRWWRSGTVGLLLTMLVVVGLVLSLDAIVTMLEEGSRKISFEQLVQIIWERLPGRIHAMLPSAMLIAVVWNLGERAQHGELNAMRTLGISSLRICLGVALPTLLVSVFFLGLAEYMAADREQPDDFSHWSRHGDRVYYNTGCGRQLLWWDLGEEGLVSWGWAWKGCFEDGKWTMRWASIYAPDAEKQVIADYSLPSTRQAMVGDRPNPSSLSASQLLEAQDYLPQSRYLQSVLLESWRRLLAPLQIALMCMLATLLPLGMLRDPRPGSRLILALVLALGFRTVETLMLTFGQGLALPALSTALMPLAVLLLFYVYCHRRFG